MYVSQAVFSAEWSFCRGKAKNRISNAQMFGVIVARSEDVKNLPFIKGVTVRILQDPPAGERSRFELFTVSQNFDAGEGERKHGQLQYAFN
jgi:hypothetical protein